MLARVRICVLACAVAYGTLAGGRWRAGLECNEGCIWEVEVACREVAAGLVAQG